MWSHDGKLELREKDGLAIARTLVEIRDRAAIDGERLQAGSMRLDVAGTAAGIPDTSPLLFISRVRRPSARPMSP